MNYMPETTGTTVRTGISEVDGLSIFYREAGKPGNPKLVLLHGFPASSHQYRNLIPALATKFHVIAMDYPGFGNSEGRRRRLALDSAQASSARSARAALRSAVSKPSVNQA